MLFQKPVDYDSLKVFGCLAFSSNVGSRQDKFQPRGVPCVFVGYPPTQKGYRLLNLITKEMFVSRDVLFHETIFPLNTDKSSAFMHPLPSEMSPAITTAYDNELILNDLPDAEQDGNTEEETPPDEEDTQ